MCNDSLDYVKSVVHADVYNYEILFSAICLYVYIIIFVRLFDTPENLQFSIPIDFYKYKH